MLPLEHDPDLADLGWQYGVAKIDDRSMTDRVMPWLAMTAVQRPKRGWKQLVSVTMLDACQSRNRPIILYIQSSVYLTKP